MQSRALLAKGQAVVNVDCRLVDTTGLLVLPPLHRASGVRITEQVADIKAAMDRVATNAAEWQIRTEYAAFTTVLNQKAVPNKFFFVQVADHGFGQPGNWQTVVDETASYIFASQ